MGFPGGRDHLRPRRKRFWKVNAAAMFSGTHSLPLIKTFTPGRISQRPSPRARNFGFVFQDYALFPHMTAWENIAFAPEAKNLLPEIWSANAEKLIKRLNLERVRKQKASVLSGGEQQRVALARALVTKPRLVLLDEPLSALDEKIRDEARLLIGELSEEYKVPFLLVTHDLRDVRALSRSVLILSQGKALASGNTQDILKTPPNFETAAAIAENQIIPVEMRGAHPLIENHVIPVTKVMPHSGKSYLVAKAWSFQLVPRGEGEFGVTIVRSSHDGVRWQCLAKLPTGQNIKAWSALDVQPKPDMDLKIDISSVMLFRGGSP